MLLKVLGFTSILARFVRKRREKDAAPVAAPAVLLFIGTIVMEIVFFKIRDMIKETSSADLRPAAD